MISFSHRGNFNNTERFLKRATSKNYKSIMEKYAKKGVEALSSATPVDTGLTASSWSYEIIQNDGSISISWKNSNIQKGVNIALILQFGHGTGNGGYVTGIDYINPALRPIFDEFVNDLWKETTT